MEMVIRDFDFELRRANGDPIAQLIGPDPGCFYCGEQVGGHLVHWHGYGAEFMSLHPDCAMALAAHLLADAFRAETGFEIPPGGDPALLLAAMAKNCFRLMQKIKATEAT